MHNLLRHGVVTMEDEWEPVRDLSNGPVSISNDLE